MTISKGQAVSVVTPFEDSVGDIVSALARHGITATRLSRNAREASNPDAVPVASYADVALLLSGARGAVVMLQFNRHPLRAHDEAIERALSAQDPTSRLRVFMPMNDGLLTRFGSLGEVFQKLGIAANECVESGMVTRAIETAQRKIAAKVLDEKAAPSFALWCERNL
ncbi:MAG: hypothetical protein Q8Q09_03345 [Deltaproteobacteria bacterium]|nr:hypothetical protein [Deltaproteobacteria bacterium]